ncbi:MAG: helix-turn-helix transcriptional regulator [Dermatophilaceae bacterium]
MSTRVPLPTESGDFTKDEVYELWTLWKAAHEKVESSVIAAATVASDLTDAEIAVLLRLQGAGGTLRQAELARLLGWHRSRLSHQLTRMAARDLVDRSGVQGNVEATTTAEGNRRLALAKPAHLAAIKRWLIDPAEDPTALRATLEALSGRADRAQVRDDAVG